MSGASFPPQKKQREWRAQSDSVQQSVSQRERRGCVKLSAREETVIRELGRVCGEGGERVETGERPFARFRV